DADDVLLLPALDPALGIHVPVSWNAELGAVHRPGAATDTLPAHRARRAAQGQRLERNRARGLADRALHAGRDPDRAALLPQHAGLAATFSSLQAAIANTTITSANPSSAPARQSRGPVANGSRAESQCPSVFQRRR